MKKIRAAFVVLFTAALLAGCAGRSGNTSTFDPGQSSIFVTQDGKLSTATVETYEDHEYYNEEEWKISLEQAVAEYNKANGEGSVTLDSCSLGKGIAKMQFDYANGNDLVQFAKEYEDTANAVNSIAVDSVEEAVKQAGTDGIVLVKPSDGKTVTMEEVLKKNGYHVVIVDSPSVVMIQTQGKIVFTSKGVALRDSFTAKTTEGKNYIIFK